MQQDPQGHAQSSIPANSVAKLHTLTFAMCLHPSLHKTGRQRKSRLYGFMFPSTPLRIEALPAPRQVLWAITAEACVLSHSPSRSLHQTPGCVYSSTLIPVERAPLLTWRLSSQPPTHSCMQVQVDSSTTCALGLRGIQVAVTPLFGSQVKL